MFGEETEAVIEGRPDFADHAFGVTHAKRFPPYVFSTVGNACLVHKVARVELRWWTPGRGGRCLLKRVHPRMYAETVCGQTKYFRKGRTQTCTVPDPDAVLCGRCHGEPATFGRDGLAAALGFTRREAHDRLGCLPEVV